MHNRQTQAEAINLLLARMRGAIEALKDVELIFLGNALALILDCNGNLVCIALDSYLQWSRKADTARNRPDLRESVALSATPLGIKPDGERSAGKRLKETCLACKTLCLWKRGASSLSSQAQIETIPMHAETRGDSFVSPYLMTIVLLSFMRASVFCLVRVHERA